MKFTSIFYTASAVYFRGYLKNTKKLRHKAGCVVSFEMISAFDKHKRVYFKRYTRLCLSVKRSIAMEPNRTHACPQR